MRILFISITSRCNLTCLYCPIATWRNNSDYPDKLTLASTTAAIEKLKPTHVEITGGEPTLVPWLNELLDCLDLQKIIYLVKSNGYKRCKNQITAWHDDFDKPPKNYDKILLILDPGKSEEFTRKENYCKDNSIPRSTIGLNNLQWNNFGTHETFFLCPDGKLKECHEGEVIADDVKNLQAEKVEWKTKCKNCKAVNDFALFLDSKRG
jgi:organic radical activating enzyme